MSDLQKQICPGFFLKIYKRLQEGLIDFYLENQTESMFLIDFKIKNPQNVRTFDQEFEKQVQVLPQTNFPFLQLRIEGQYSYKYMYKYQKLKPDPITKEIQVAQNIDLIIKQEDLQQRIVYELDNKTDNSVHFEIMIMELSGIRSECGKTIFISDVKSNTKSEICELSFDGIWSYKYSYTYRID